MESNLSPADSHYMKRIPDRTHPSNLPIYTPEQRRKRDASPWTLVQGILAPLQFLVFLVSLALVLGALNDASLAYYATVSVVIKTLILYAIMITGSLWEKDVFDRYLFAKAFYWEDMVSMLVLALHTAYLIVILFDLLPLREQLLLALAAYASYLINAAQFLYKFRLVRKSSNAANTTAGACS